MHKACWVSCLWPGLAQVWLRGAWSGLALAVGFALLVNLLLISSLVWTELVGAAVRGIGWAVVLLFWSGSALGSRWWLASQQPATRQEQIGPLFPEALSEYLQGHWLEAEDRLNRILRRDERDVEAHLLLASLMRRTRRWDEAQQGLQRLLRFDEADHWRFEIQRELALVDADRQEASEDAAAVATNAAPERGVSDVVSATEDALESAA